MSRWRFVRRVPLLLKVNCLRPQQGRKSPVKIQIETISRCDRNCPSCSHARHGVAGHRLGTDELRRLLAALPPHPRRVILSGAGDPLENPAFFALVDTLGDLGTGCVFFTDGTHLPPETRHAVLVRDNIREVCISCDSAHPHTFEALHREADFAGWKESVRDFLAEARQSPHPPKVTANIVAGKCNIGELGDIFRLVKELGFARANLMEPLPRQPIPAPWQLMDSDIQAIRSGGLRQLARQIDLRVDWYLRRPALPPHSTVRCTEPWEYIFVRANGDIVPCPTLLDSAKAVSMGNIFERKFEDIWRGDRFREFRKSSASGTSPWCRTCPFY